MLVRAGIRSGWECGHGFDADGLGLALSVPVEQRGYLTGRRPVTAEITGQIAAGSRSGFSLAWDAKPVGSLADGSDVAVRKEVARHAIVPVRC